ncbi:MAG: aminoacyl-tRNA hydrolase [Candidatus Omnitrophota bacterium]
MKLIVGLGNPGSKYENTRHNAGFKVAYALAERYNIKLDSKIFNSLIGKGKVLGEETIIALPQLYMNRSGAAVKTIILRKEIELEDVLVICDDINITLGTIRIRAGGSSGGHKGLSSIIENLESEDFARLRIGIGKEVIGPQLSDYVLSLFKKSEIKILYGAIEIAVDCCEVWVKEGPSRAANIFNQKRTQVMLHKHPPLRGEVSP